MSQRVSDAADIANAKEFEKKRLLERYTYTLRGKISRYLDTHKLGPYLDFLEAFLSFVYCAQYVWLSYQEKFTDFADYMLIIEQLMAMIFFADFCLRLFLYEPRWAYALKFASIVDLLTVCPILVTAIVRPEESLWYTSFLGRLTYPLRFARVTVRLYRVIHSKSGTVLSLSRVQRQVVYLYFLILTLILVATGYLQIVEYSNFDIYSMSWSPASDTTGPSVESSSSPFGDLQYIPHNVSRITFHEALYDVMLTLATVAAPAGRSPLAKVTVILLLIITFVIIPFKVSQFTTMISRTSPYSVPFRNMKNRRHVVLTGEFSVESLREFLRGFFHHDYGTVHERMMCVILCPKEPNEEARELLLQPFYRKRVQWIKGFLLNRDDCRRARVEDADACFVLCNRDAVASEQDAADVATVMRTLAVWEYHDVVQSFVQVNRYTNKLYAESMSDEVFCCDEVKMMIMAQDCLCPGLCTLLWNLTRTLKQSDFVCRRMSTLKIVQPWMSRYVYSLSQEFYRVPIGSVFAGVLYEHAAKFALDQLGVIMLAVQQEREGPNDKGEDSGGFASRLLSSQRANESSISIDGYFDRRVSEQNRGESTLSEDGSDSSDEREQSAQTYLSSVDATRSKRYRERAQHIRLQRLDRQNTKVVFAPCGYRFRGGEIVLVVAPTATQAMRLSRYTKISPQLVEEVFGPQRGNGMDNADSPPLHNRHVNVDDLEAAPLLRKVPSRPVPRVRQCRSEFKFSNSEFFERYQARSAVIPANSIGPLSDYVVSGSTGMDAELVDRTGHSSTAASSVEHRSIPSEPGFVRPMGESIMGSPPIQFRSLMQQNRDRSRSSMSASFPARPGGFFERDRNTEDTRPASGEDNMLNIPIPQNLPPRSTEPLLGRHKVDQSEGRSRRSSLTDRLRGTLHTPPADIRDHIVLCAFSIDLSLLHFIAPLNYTKCRFENKTKHPIVILCLDQIPKNFEPFLLQFEHVYVVKGSPCDVQDLVRAGVPYAFRVVILSQPNRIARSHMEPSGAGDTNTNHQSIGSEMYGLLERMDDSLALMSYIAIQTHFSHVYTIIELRHQSNIQLLRSHVDKHSLMQARDDEENTMVLISAYASGRVYCSSMLDSLLSEVYYNPFIKHIVHSFTFSPIPVGSQKDNTDSDAAEIVSNSLYINRICQIRVPSYFHGRIYREFFFWVISQGAVPIAIYRRMYESETAEQYSSIPTGSNQTANPALRRNRMGAIEASENGRNFLAASRVMHSSSPCRSRKRAPLAPQFPRISSSTQFPVPSDEVGNGDEADQQSTENAWIKEQVNHTNMVEARDATERLSRFVYTNPRPQERLLASDLVFVMFDMKTDPN